MIDSLHIPISYVFSILRLNVHLMMTIVKFQIPGAPESFPVNYIHRLSLSMKYLRLNYRNHGQHQ
jgi:hypothetical protein